MFGPDTKTGPIGMKNAAVRITGFLVLAAIVLATGFGAFGAVLPTIAGL